MIPHEKKEEINRLRERFPHRDTNGNGQTLSDKKSYGTTSAPTTALSRDEGSMPPVDIKLIQRKISGPARSLSYKKADSLSRLLASTRQVPVTNPLLSMREETEYLQDAELFEKDYVQNVRERPYQSTAKRWLVNGSGIGAILALPFGPIGLLVGALLGTIIGLCSGLLSDLIKLKKKQGEAERQKIKIKHLVRWAEFHFSSSEDQLQLLFKVIIEYQALAAVGGFSHTARTQLRMLYKFLKRDDVQHVLWTYLDYFFSHWRQMGLKEISMCNTVFEVCIQCCNHLRKKRPPVVQRMEDILSECPAVIRLFAQAESLQRKQRERAVRDGDWLMYADAGEITAQEIFRRNMAQTKASFMQPLPLQEETGIETGKEEAELEKKRDQLEMEEEDEEEEELSIPERDPGVQEIVMSECDEEEEKKEFIDGREQIEDEGYEVMSLKPEEEVVEAPYVARLPSIEQMGYQRYATLSGATVSTAPASVSAVQGPLTPVSVHVAISRAKETESAIEEGLIKKTSKRKIEEDFVSVPMTSPTKEKPPSKKRKLPAEVADTLTHKKSIDSVSIREKRLFRSLTDLVEFNLDLKHQTPIGSYEMEFLTRLEIHDKASKEWDCVVNKPHCQVYKFKGDSPVVLVKAYATFDGISNEVLSHFIRHIPTRGYWDKTFEDYRLIEKNVEGNEVIYCLMKAPWPIANRDFLQWRRTEIEKTGDVLIVMRSASHPNFPEKQGVVRAETIISGYIIRRAESNTNSSKLFLVAQTDVRGLLPKWAVNQGAQRAPIQWTDALKKICADYVKKYGGRLPDYETPTPSI